MSDSTCESHVAVGAPSPVALDLFSRASSAEDDLRAFHALLQDDMESYHARSQLIKPRLEPSGSPSVQRLKASATGASYSRKLKCLRPTRLKPHDPPLPRRFSFDRDLLSLKLQRGRMCTSKLCSPNRCGLHVRDAVLTPDEAAALVAHGQGVFATEGASARDVGWPYRRVEFMRSAHNGSAAGHVLTLRLAERLRRVAAEVFELPLARVGHAETLLAMRRVDNFGAGAAGAAAGTGDLSAGEGRSWRSGPCGGAATATSAEQGQCASEEAGGGGHSVYYGKESSYHCDESLSSHFHFSAVAFLSEHVSRGCALGRPGVSMAGCVQLAFISEHVSRA